MIFLHIKLNSDYNLDIFLHFKEIISSYCCFFNPAASEIVWHTQTHTHAHLRGVVHTWAWAWCPLVTKPSPSYECVFPQMCFLCQLPEWEKENQPDTCTLNTLTLTSGHRRRQLCAAFGLLARQLLPSPSSLLLRLLYSTSSLCAPHWAEPSHVLLCGFRPVSGTGPAASGHLLHHRQPAASLPHGRNHLHPR